MEDEKEVELNEIVSDLSSKLVSAKYSMENENLNLFSKLSDKEAEVANMY